VLGKFVGLHERKNRVDPLARVDLAEWLDVWRSHNVIENAADLNWYRSGPVAEHNAPEKAGVFGGGKEQVDVPMSGPTACGRSSPKSLIT
jgi:hypothetical protein